MSFLNRIKCTASIDDNGFIVIGDAKPGFIAMPDTWSPGLEADCFIPYLLEDASSNWEMGYIEVAGGAPLLFAGLPRKIKQSSFAPDGFPSGTTGLVFSQGPAASDVVTLTRGSTNSPSAYAGGANPITSSIPDGLAIGPAATVSKDGGTALGARSKVGGYDAIAVGRDAQAMPAKSVAIGPGAQTSCKGEVAIGDAAAPSARSFPLKATGIDSTTGQVGLYTLDSDTFTIWGYPNSGLANAGPVRVSALVCVDRDGQYGVKEHSRVVQLDYVVWSAGASAEVLGTPTITTLFAGVSAPDVTVDIHPTDGVPSITVVTTGVSVHARTLLKTEFINTAGAV